MIATDRDIVIRGITTLAELREVEALQKEVWGISDLEVVPFPEMIAANEAGGMVIGAFAERQMVGFVYGFVGLEGGRLTIHSHMAAVKPGWRDLKVGYRLKLAQRERALSQGITEVTWTFDPLQSLNAHFNFARLGVVAAKYKVNFYGSDTTFLLPGLGTDRFWVRWLLDSPRVRRRIEGMTPPDESFSEINSALPLVTMNADGSPSLNNQTEIAAAAGAPPLLIDVPHDIGSLQRASPELAVTWREVTRQGFTTALAAGYMVVEFHRRQDQAMQFGTYLLSPSCQAERTW
ncbi:MAG TPA: hypothetical protein VFD58_32740 [Blastocatellia bacterium]|nr:hypothetical protein [Blastocatellia bacterium]